MGDAQKFLTIVDFDSALFGSATILEDTYIITKNIETGEEREFKNLTAFKGRGLLPETLGGWLKEENIKNGTDLLPEDFEITQKVRRNSIPFSKAQEFVTSSAESIRAKEWCDTVRFVVGGEGNYRKDINTLYKANRGDKPLMFTKLRDWFLDEYKDEVILSIQNEADDVLSIYGWWGYNKAVKTKNYLDNNVCLVFTDKDILQVPGNYWNPKTKKDKPSWQTEKQAAKALFVQMIVGDTSDNIKGLEGLPLHTYKEFQIGQGGVGPTKALTLLSDCDSIEQMEERVKYLYQAYYCDIWEDEFQAAFQMLKLQEIKGVIPKFIF